MNKRTKILSVGAAAAALMVVLVALSVAAPVGSNRSILLRIAPTSTPKAPAGSAIPLKQLPKSISAEVQIDVNGKIDGERTQGELNAVVNTNNQGSSKITVTDPLLGEIAAQVGGSVVGLFTPSSVDIYKVPEGTYIVANSLIPVCVKPASSDAADSLEEMSPQGMLSMLTKSEVARGVKKGQENINGTTADHYVINGDAFLTAAQNSSDPKLKKFASSLWNAEDADLYVDAKNGYPLAFRGSYSGEYEPLGFEGDFDVTIGLTGVNKNPTIKLPASCSNPITP